MLIPGKYSSLKKISIEENHTSLNRYKKRNFNTLTFVPIKSYLLKVMANNIIVT